MIGGWGHAGFVVNDFAKTKPNNADLVAISQTTSEEGLIKLPNNIKGVETFSDYKEMLSIVKPDVVVVSTRLDLINQVAIDVAENGCHLICEKPIAANLFQLEKLYKSLNNNNLNCILLINNRSNPYLRAVRSVIKRGKIGEVILVNARKSYPWSDDRVEKFPIKYGGTIGWVGIHALDFINTATDLYFTKVVGMESNQSNPDFASCPDNSALVFELSNGGHATVSIDYHRPKGSVHHGDSWIRVVGKKGTIEANLITGEISCCTEEEVNLEVEIPSEANIFQQYYDYLLNKSYTERFERIKDAAYKMTKACIIAQKPVIENKFLNI